MSAGVSGPPNVFPLRTYFHMNSPIIDEAIASTTLVWLAEVLIEPLAVYAVAVENWWRWPKPLALTMSLGIGGIDEVSAMLGVADNGGDLLLDRLVFATGAADLTFRKLSLRWCLTP
jgi:hypothetical protein